MGKITGFGVVSAVALAIVLTGCQKNANQTTTQQSAAPQLTPTEGAPGNPENGNLATPVSTTDTQAPQQQPVPAGQPVPADQTAYNASSDYNGDFDTDQQPVYASEPPPPLPDYTQPPCPDEDDIWTPGYWNYSQSGYYWVPGAWVLAPFVGALWTPPYWAFSGGRYVLHHGYWAPHIGFYGGVNYGFGYTGRGYYGGYWRDRTFFYNRSVTNVNVNVVHNVYNYNVRANNMRVSYNGGRGGIEARPTPAELAVLHERRVAPIAAQTQHVRQAADNRSQFAQANHGRPQMLAAARPLPTTYHAPAAEARPTPTAARPEVRPNERPAPNAAAADHNARPEAQPARPAERPNERPAAEPRTNAMPPRNERPAATPAPQPNRPEAHPAPAARPQPQPREQPRPEARPAEQPHPAAAARPQPQPREQPRPEARPAEQPHPAPAARPQPQPREQSHPEARPAEQPHAAPARPPEPAAHPEAAHPAPAPHDQPRPNPNSDKSKGKDTSH